MQHHTHNREHHFLTDLRKLCAEHNVALAPRGDFDHQGGCELLLHGVASGTVEFRGASVDEASAWLEDDEQPITVTE